jgi:arylsulfatase A-like enzyme
LPHNTSSLCRMHRLLLSAAATASTGFTAAANKSPHLVFVMADDLGWSNVGYHNEHAKTPNIDHLVREGIELDRHYVYYYCAPTRASFLTGRYPAHVDEEFDECTPQGTAPLKMTMIAAKLKLAGYVSPRAHRTPLKRLPVSTRSC